MRPEEPARFTKKEEVFLTQHHQCHFHRVDTWRLLDLALVGGGVRGLQVTHGDGGVALSGASCEAEPGRDRGVTVAVHLSPRVRQDLEGETRMKQVFLLMLPKAPPLPPPEDVSVIFCRVELLRELLSPSGTPFPCDEVV